jgi:Arc/MetJ family transcription regulator
MLGIYSLSHMAGNLALGDKLLNEALRLGGHRTKKATVTQALQEYVQRRRQLRAAEFKARTLIS